VEAMNAKVDQTSKRVSEWRVGQHVERGGMGLAGPARRAWRDGARWRWLAAHSQTDPTARPRDSTVECGDS
jgi:hypothetical protein